MKHAVVGFVAILAVIAATPRAGHAEEAKEQKMASIEVRSSAFSSGAAIPRRYTKDGEDVSPSLEWSGIPAGAKQLALICDDPDAPRAKPWVHWVAYGIASDSRGLPEGAKSGFVAGKNDFGELGYGGPKPPPGHGPHHYHFKVYALDAAIDGAQGKTKDELLAAMEGHVLATGEVVGTYER
jgi:Raf kinase inhibitor-like YbhB/YbcL family protein